MIEIEDCALIGKLRKTIGFQGDLVLQSLIDLPDDLLDFSFFHVEINASLIPFFFDEFQRLNARSARLHFPDVRDLEMARAMVDCKVYLEKILMKAFGLPDAEGELTGYLVTDQHHGALGRVQGLLKYPGQDLLEVAMAGKTVMIPLVQDLIRSIDHDNRSIDVSLPEGLLTVND